MGVRISQDLQNIKIRDMIIEHSEKTVLALEHADRKITTELNWDAGMEELLDAFYGACVATTWHPTTILEGMRDFAEERLETFGCNKEE